MAAIARTIKNLLRSLTGLKKEALTPQFNAIVVIIDAAIKYKMKNGNIFLKLTVVPSFAFCFSLRVRTNASTTVIGIMASVRVSFTVTAVSSVAEPRFHILSQVEAQAVTEDVSLTAVPAKIPNASPLPVSNPTSFPSVGKISAAKTLKKKITEIACATSSSSASITGAVAATAEPPQMEEPTPTNVDIFPGICISLQSTNATISDTEIVLRMIGKDCFPSFFLQ